jgi:hypothetical protein
MNKQQLRITKHFFFMILFAVVMTALTSLTAMAGEKVSIPEGTVLMVYATDNRTYVDYLNVNMNEYVRLKADGSVSPQTVNGMNIDDVFVETFFD